MKAESVPVGSRILDSLPLSSGNYPDGVYDTLFWTFNGACLYLPYQTDSSRIKACQDNGMGVMLVTLAGAYNNGYQDELAQLKACGYPKGCTVWLDVEGKHVYANWKDAKAKITEWCKAINGEGYEAGIYFAPPQPFTSEEMYAFPARKYWRGQGSIRDRLGNLAEPFRDWANCRGWNMVQAAPSQVVAGVLVDYNMVIGDYKGQTPTWAVAE